MCRKSTKTGAGERDVAVSFGEYNPSDKRAVEQRGEVIYTCGSDNHNNPIRDIRIEISSKAVISA